MSEQPVRDADNQARTPVRVEYDHLVCLTDELGAGGNDLELTAVRFRPTPPAFVLIKRQK